MECQETAKKERPKYIHGNYPGYYSYRREKNPASIYDARLKDISETFKQFPWSSNGLSDIVEGKSCLDLGCNSGLVTIDVATHFHPSWILGVDLDRVLILKARHNLEKLPQLLSNIRFSCDNILDYLHCPMKHDVIFCLSMTKWVHLNSGDEGIISLFEKIKQSLKVGGIFILEPQPYISYARRKNLSKEISRTYKSINFFPEQFEEFLVTHGWELLFQVGSMHDSQGFQRCILVFKKL